MSFPDVHPAEWHEARRRGLGGSCWTDLLQVEPYGCRRRLWYSKRGVEPDFPEEVTGPMYRGQLLEPIVVRLFEESSGRTTFEARDWHNLDAMPEWWIGNPDRLVRELFDGDRARVIAPEGVLEAKSVNSHRLRRIRRETPLGWVAQVQHYLALTGLNWGVIHAVEFDRLDQETVEVERDDDLIEKMRQAGEMFWLEVTTGKQPAALDPSDVRCKGCPWRVTCHGEMYRDTLPPAPGELERDEDTTYLADLDANTTGALIAAIERWDTCKAIVDDAKTLMAEARADLEDALGDLQVVDMGSRRIHFREQIQRRLDTRAIRAAHPEIAEAHTKTITTRPLRVGKRS